MFDGIDLSAEITVGLIVAIVLAVAAWIINISRARMSRLANRMKMLHRISGSLVANGVSNLFFERSDYMRFRKEQTAEEYMSTAKHELIYVGYWLAQGLDIGGAHATILRLVNSGVRVEVILLSPNSPTELLQAYADFFDLDVIRLQQKLASSHERLCQIREQIDAAYAEGLTVRSHETFLNCSVFLFDRKDESVTKMLVDTKFHGVERDRSFGMELRPSGKPDGMYERICRSIDTIRASAGVA